MFVLGLQLWVEDRSLVALVAPHYTTCGNQSCARYSFLIIINDTIHDKATKRLDAQLAIPPPPHDRYPRVASAAAAAAAVFVPDSVLNTHTGLARIAFHCAGLPCAAAACRSRPHTGHYSIASRSQHTHTHTTTLA